MNKLTIYNTDDDTYTKVEEPDSSLIYTYADYLKWKFEERLELFKGRVFKLSAPNTTHQKVAGDIFFSIKKLIGKQKCTVFMAPFDVRLPLKNKKNDDEVITVVQPDICVICDESKIDSRGCCGAPDLAVEVLSPGNSKKEIRLKYELYEEAGVKEYWLVYPVEESVAVFQLNDKNKFAGATIYAGDEIILSNTVPGLSINLTEIFPR